MEITYTVGVKGKFWPFFINYKVKTHQLETQITWKNRATGAFITKDVPTRLVLTLTDDSVVIIGAIEDKTWKVYPDLIDALNRAREAHTPWVDDTAQKKITSDSGISPSSSPPEPLNYLAQQLTPTTQH